MLAAAVMGFLAGALVSFLATTKFRDDADAARARPATYVRHKTSGRRYERVCEATMHVGPGGFVVLMDTEADPDGRFYMRREIWTEEAAKAEFVPA